LKLRGKKSRHSTADPALEPYRQHLRQKRREAVKRLQEPFRRRSILVQLGLFALVLALWRLPLVNPVKLLVVLFHEVSHVLVAYATGGVVFGIAIDPGGAGVTMGMGGNEALIVAAGYVGSLLIGFLLYSLSATWKVDEVWGVLCLFCCLTMAFGWLNDFTTFFGYGTITLMFVGLFKFPEGLQRFFLRWIATTSCLYPILDVSGEFFQESARGFTVRGRLAGSDVSQLAQITGLSEALIAGVWGITGLLAVCVLIDWCSKKDAASQVKKTLFQRRRLTPVLYPKYNPDDTSNLPRHEIHL
jgi:peptidase M50B-like protein